MSWKVVFEDEDGKHTNYHDSYDEAMSWIRAQEARVSSGEEFELIDGPTESDRQDFSGLIISDTGLVNYLGNKFKKGLLNIKYDGLSRRVSSLNKAMDPKSNMDPKYRSYVLRSESRDNLDKQVRDYNESAKSINGKLITDKFELPKSTKANFNERLHKCFTSIIDPGLLKTLANKYPICKPTVLSKSQPIPHNDLDGVSTAIKEQELNKLKDPTKPSDSTKSDTKVESSSDESNDIITNRLKNLYDNHKGKLAAGAVGLGTLAYMTKKKKKYV